MYHDDGKTPKVEETYVNGKREGVSRAYFANGKPQREVTFKDGLLDGPMTEWDETGRKIGEVELQGGKRDGKFIAVPRRRHERSSRRTRTGRLLSTQRQPAAADARQ